MRHETKDFYETVADSEVSFTGTVEGALSEQLALMAMVDMFSKFMKAKLVSHLLACDKGGWDDEARCPSVGLVSALLEAVEANDWVSVANYAAMLWNREEE